MKIGRDALIEVLLCVGIGAVLLYVVVQMAIGEFSR